MCELVADCGRLPLSEFFQRILERTGYLEVLQAENSPESQSRIENLRELVNAAAAAEERGESLSEFLDQAALVSDTDDYDERARVSLMTLNSAKGLEFSTVSLVGLEEGIFPHRFSFDEAGIEEERRLCYVGMTRAKDRLILSWARGRRSSGQEAALRTRCSRFLKEIPTNLLESVSLATFSPKPRTSWQNAVNSVQGVERFLDARGRQPSAPSRSQGLRFGQPRRYRRWEPGTQVRHPKYGLGTVIHCEGEGEDTKVTVSFPGYGQKKLVERHASLEKA
jgi:DNA helicase-2/ATP-dependent DNA helicase PcrA